MADPIDPEAPFTDVTFTASEDPEGSPVAYTWQLSRRPDFGLGATVALELGPDSTTLPLTVATAAALFDTTWTGWPSVPLGVPITFYHRVITTDGARYTIGPAATVSLIRGTITSDESPGEVPGGFALHGNYPNPFNPSTTITFDLPSQAEVAVEVFDVMGRQVLALPPRAMAAGQRQRIDVDASGFASGTYLYRVVARTASATLVANGRMTVLK